MAENSLRDSLWQDDSLEYDSLEYDSFDDYSGMSKKIGNNFHFI